jgi:hypothetical protein
MEEGCPHCTSSGPPSKQPPFNPNANINIASILSVHSCYEYFEYS